MFAGRHFAARMFAPRYFPGSSPRGPSETFDFTFYVLPQLDVTFYVLPNLDLVLPL